MIFGKTNLSVAANDRILALALAVLVLMPRLQSAPPQNGDQVLAPGSGRPLSVYILEGNGAVNSIRSRVATPIVVEVRDERSLPVEGAEVVLQLPAAGPSGSFAGQGLSWTGRTDANGQAVVTVSPNGEAGRLRIQVIARLGGRIGHGVITQTNSTKAVAGDATVSRKASSKWIYVVIAAAGGAAAGGAAWARRGNGGNSPTVVGLQPGPIGVGAPR